MNGIQVTYLFNMWDSIKLAKYPPSARDFPRPPGKWRLRRYLCAPLAPPSGRPRRPFGKPPPSAAVKEMGENENWGTPDGASA